MHQSHGNRLAFFLFALAALLIVSGCTKKAESEKPPKSVRISGVMAAEGTDVQEAALGEYSDAIQAGIESAGLNKGEPNYAIEVIILRASETGGQGVLKVHAGDGDAIVAETLLEFSDATELASKVTDYLNTV